MPVAVIARAHLVGQAISAALYSRGLTPALLEWPDRLDDVVAVRRRAVRSGYRVVLVVCDLDVPENVRSVELLMTPGQSPQWLLLSDSPPGPSWGKLLDEGVAGILSASTTIDGLVRAVRDAVSGRSPTPEGVRERVLQEWHDIADEQREIIVRIERLSPREYEILTMLYDGIPVAQIAAAAGVSESTVRTQVKSLRSKLAVDSQLAAVATFRRALETLTRRPAGA